MWQNWGMKWIPVIKIYLISWSRHDGHFALKLVKKKKSVLKHSTYKSDSQILTQSWLWICRLGKCLPSGIQYKKATDNLGSQLCRNDHDFPLFWTIFKRGYSIRWAIISQWDIKIGVEWTLSGLHRYFSPAQNAFQLFSSSNHRYNLKIVASRKGDKDIHFSIPKKCLYLVRRIYVGT